MFFSNIYSVGLYKVLCKDSRTVANLVAVNERKVFLVVLDALTPAQIPLAVKPFAEVTEPFSIYLISIDIHP